MPLSHRHDRLGDDHAWQHGRSDFALLDARHSYPF